MRCSMVTVHRNISKNFLKKAATNACRIYNVDALHFMQPSMTTCNLSGNARSTTGQSPRDKGTPASATWRLGRLLDRHLILASTLSSSMNFRNLTEIQSFSLKGF